MVGHRSQHRSHRLLLVSPPRAQTALPSPPRGSRCAVSHEPPAWVRLERTPQKKGHSRVKQLGCCGVEPSNAPVDKVISRRIQYRIPQTTPRHQGRDCQIQGRRGIMHQISSADRASNPGKEILTEACVDWHMMMNPTQP